jgi:hypothetical protein
VGWAEESIRLIASRPMGAWAHSEKLCWVRALILAPVSLHVTARVDSASPKDWGTKLPFHFPNLTPAILIPQT